MYEVPQARESLSLFYLVGLLFGVLRLTTPRLLGRAVGALYAGKAGGRNRVVAVG